jgi:heme/copper-type cytochrome/quinol oxidase subunit 2
MSYQTYMVSISCGVAAMLALAVWRYARWLDQFDGSYNPEYTGYTVIGGVAIVLSAYGLLAVAGIVSWFSFLVMTGYFLVSGVVIMAWQRDQAIRRSADRQHRETTDDSYAECQETDG